MQTNDEFRRTGAAERFITLADSGAPIVLPGGKGTFTDVCGGDGCLAVAYGRDSKVSWSIPFDGETIAEAPQMARGAHEYLGFGIADDISIAGLQSFADGDLLLTFNLANAFPYSYGIMRVGATEPYTGAGPILPTIAPRLLPMAQSPRLCTKSARARDTRTLLNICAGQCCAARRKSSMPT